MTCKITDIAGIRIGHAHNEKALTGCTVVICENGATGGVDQRGGAPGTRESDALRPLHLVQEVHGIVLAGGSAFGLDAASGVMRYLEEKGAGFDVRVAKIPIVPAAILFDLAIGRADVRPDHEMGYQACMNATSLAPASGNVGAGMGATVGKISGINLAVKSGIGSACIDIGSGLMVGALVAVNAFGDVIDPGSGEIIGGARSEDVAADSIKKENIFANTLVKMASKTGKKGLNFDGGENTSIGVVITNARLTKEQANFVSMMAHDGLARTIRPVHTLMDGDTIFTLATGALPADVNIIGAFAAEMVAAAVLDAVWSAKPAGGLPSASSIRDTHRKGNNSHAR